MICLIAIVIILVVVIEEIVLVVFAGFHDAIVLALDFQEIVAIVIASALEIIATSVIALDVIDAQDAIDVVIGLTIVTCSTLGFSLN